MWEERDLQLPGLKAGTKATITFINDELLDDMVFLPRCSCTKVKNVGDKTVSFIYEAPNKRRKTKQTIDVLIKGSEKETISFKLNIL